MSGLKDFFENLFTGNKRPGVISLNLKGAGPAESARPAPSGPEMAAPIEQSIPEVSYEKGDVIGGKYEVFRLLGRGGFGEVYLVFDRETKEGYALKTFRQKFVADTEVKEKFKREALLWLNLEVHPYILAARSVEEFSGRLFVTMEYIASDDHGRVSLADHLARARGPLDTNQSLQWAIMFCHGMEHANQRGIKSHRDIKPANILIRQDGTLMISDFGLAAAAEVAWEGRGGSWESAGQEGFVGLSLFQTEGKHVWGTPGYIAPEVFRGEGADVRSDIYSFGLVLWQMAAGGQVPPFAVGVATPRRPRDVDRFAREIYERQMKNRAPAMGVPFEGVIDGCLATEPSKRFASFTTLRGELETIFRQRTGRSVELPDVYLWAVPFWTNKGASLRTLGRYDEAVTCFKKALEIDPDDAPTHYSLGTTLQAKHDFAGAIAEYQTAIRLDTRLGAAHSNLGLALRAKGDLDGAMAEYQTAIRLDTRLGAAHSNLGLALRAKGDIDGATTEYRTAILLQPDIVLQHSNLGLALQAKGDLDGAITEYRTTLRLQPDFAFAHSNLGLALKDKGDLDGAIAEYRTAIHLEPDLTAAHYNLGLALQAKGDQDGAIAECQTAIRLQPDDAAAHADLGTAFQAKGDLNGAIAEYRTAISLDTRLAAAHSNLGTALYLSGDLDGAIAEYRTTIRLKPDSPVWRYNLGTALKAKGDLNGAIAEYRTAICLQPDLAMPHYNLGNALSDKAGTLSFSYLRDLEEAIAEYRTALRLQPDLTGARRNLEIALITLRTLSGRPER